MNRKKDKDSRPFKISMVLIIIALLSQVGCTGMRPTVFIHQEFDFNFVEKVAVIPFENLSKDQGADLRATRFFITELFESRAFDIVEPGEVNRVLGEFSLVRAAVLSQEQIIAIGKKLKVQAIFLGSVSESASMRSGSNATNIVTLVVRMVEVETGSTVWSATHTEGGRGFWSSVFGTGEKSKSGVMRSCVRKTLGTLIK